MSRAVEEAQLFAKRVERGSERLGAAHRDARAALRAAREGAQLQANDEAVHLSTVR